VGDDQVEIAVLDLEFLQLMTEIGDFRVVERVVRHGAFLALGDVLLE
jgi:hypothetical protein